MRRGHMHGAVTDRGGQHLLDRGGRVSRFKTRYKGLMSG